MWRRRKAGREEKTQEMLIWRAPDRTVLRIPESWDVWVYQGMTFKRVETVIYRKVFTRWHRDSEAA